MVTYKKRKDGSTYKITDEGWHVEIGSPKRKRPRLKMTKCSYGRHSFSRVSGMCSKCGISQNQACLDWEKKNPKEAKILFKKLRKVC